MPKQSNLGYFKRKTKSVYYELKDEIVQTYISPEDKVNQWFSLRRPLRYTLLEEHLRIMEGRYLKDIARKYCINCGNYGIDILRNVIHMAVADGFLENRVRQLEKKYRFSLMKAHHFMETGRPSYTFKKEDRYTREQELLLLLIAENSNFFHEKGRLKGQPDWIRIEYLFRQNFISPNGKNWKNLALKYYRLKKRNNSLNQ